MTKQEINNVVKDLKQGDRVFMAQLHSPYKSEFIFEYLSVNLLSLYCTVAHAPYKIEIDDIAHIELLDKQGRPTRTKKAKIMFDDFLIRYKIEGLKSFSNTDEYYEIVREIQDIILKLPEIDVELKQAYSIKAQDIEIEG